MPDERTPLQAAKPARRHGPADPPTTSDRSASPNPLATPDAPATLDPPEAPNRPGAGPAAAGGPNASSERAATPLPPDATRAELGAAFELVREHSEHLVEPLSPEDCGIQSMEDASPAKWHLAHTTWYFETFLLEPSQSDYVPFDPAFRVLFNSYYQLVGDQHPRPRRGLLSRPDLETVLAYRRHVDDAMQRWLDVCASEGSPIERGLFELGLHHEQQHQELLLTDIKHALCTHPLDQVYRGVRESAVTTPKPLSWHRLGEGIYEVGAGALGFAFDCERPRHRRWLEGCELGSRLITSGEYLAFMQAGGYERPELWLADGWALVSREGPRAPLYWFQREGEWWERTLGGARPLRRDLPVVHVSFYEADAFARWFGARLPDEAEWEAFASRAPVIGNLMSDQLGPVGVPATHVPEEHPAQLFGDAWEWTRSAYAPYPGFAPPEGAVGEYNGKFMCNQMVLRGGSCATPLGHVRASYRNFFYPHQRWQFSGIRLARDVR